MGPLVLAVPVFNAERFLAATLDSLNAEGDAVRWWLQDGASTDRTLEIARAAARPGDTVRSRKDNGQADAINHALQEMGGEIIGFINGDDLLAHGTAARVLDYFAAHPEVDLVYGSVEWIDEAGTITGHHAGRIDSVSDVLDIYRVWWANRQWVQPEVFFRRSLFEKVGGFNTDYHLAFDYDFWVRCFLSGARVAHIPQVFAKFRLHAAQKSSAAAKAANEIRSIVRKHLNADAPVGAWARWSLTAQLDYDRYQLGETVDQKGNRQSFTRALFTHPQWLLSPAVRERTQSSLAKALGLAKPSAHK
jgi:glycosyltransferase involved in cell wall biosynthesis